MGGGWVALGALLCACGVAAAAFGAHALAGRLDERALELWELAGRYLLYGGFALMLVGILAYQRVSRAFGGPGWFLLLGTGLFCGTLFGLALGGPRWLGAITPVGGTLVILGFLLLAWAATRSPS
jgi:uncharacterized membrane protein YgdD (TMEM256/DUF423 family)